MEPGEVQGLTWVLLYIITQSPAQPQPSPLRSLILRSHRAICPVTEAHPAERCPGISRKTHQHSETAVGPHVAKPGLTADHQNLCSSYPEPSAKRHFSAAPVVRCGHASESLSPEQWNVGTSDVCPFQGWPIQTPMGESPCGFPFCLQCRRPLGDCGSMKSAQS